MSPSASSLPNTFVVGAPKCGTTAITRYLEAHPEVFVAGRKDLHFFGSDLGFRNRPREDRATYLARFASEEAAQAVHRVDSSVWYLYSREALAEMAAFHPEARAIALIRHPVDAMYALWSQLRLNGLGDETIASFEGALAAESARAAGQQIPAHTPLPEALLYRQVVSFSQQLERAFTALGRERVHVIVQEEMKADTERSLHELFAWLGVRTDVVIDTRPVNRAKAVRSEGMRRLLRAVPRGWKDRVPPPVRAALSRRARSLNARHEARKPLSPETRARLEAELAPEIARIEAVLGRPVEAWARREGEGQSA